jgi:phenylacetate-coenzyme A ligase PaaK-like adenylate-forming protein
MSPLSSFIPDKERMGNILRLFTEFDIFDASAASEAVFVEALKEMLQWHIERNGFYADYFRYFHFSPENLHCIEDCISLPFFHANYMKTHVFTSIDPTQAYKHFTSSGTTGQKSQTFFDLWSWNLMSYLVERNLTFKGFITDQPVNYLMFTYEPYPESKLGTAASDMLLSTFAPINRMFFALRQNGRGGHEFDLFGTINALKEFEKESLPVRIFGFPSFFYFTLQRMYETGEPPLKLHPESLTIFGGGWKGAAEKAIPKIELYERAQAQLGIPEQRCGDSFGSVEHFVPYFECPHHHFHVPVWSKVMIRDVKTLQAVGYNTPGFLHFVSPYVSCYPGNSVMMGDLATLHKGETCGCGINTPYFEILGRAGTSKNKSCAIAASELLKR